MSGFQLARRHSKPWTTAKDAVSCAMNRRIELAPAAMTAGLRGRAPGRKRADVAELSSVEIR
jgi:hypothetical protein